MGPSPTYHPPEGEECKTSVEHGLPLWGEPAVGYSSRRPRPSPMCGSRFVGARAVGPWVGEQKPLGKTSWRGNPSPESTYLPTSPVCIMKWLRQPTTGRKQYKNRFHGKCLTICFLLQPSRTHQPARTPAPFTLKCQGITRGSKSIIGHRHHSWVRWRPAQIAKDIASATNVSVTHTATNTHCGPLSLFKRGTGTGTPAATTTAGYIRR